MVGSLAEATEERELAKATCMQVASLYHPLHCLIHTSGGKVTQCKELLMVDTSDNRGRSKGEDDIFRVAI